MASLLQVEANRRNAQKSTGPRTAEGKAVVAQNALQHGLFCKGLLAEGEDPAELARHERELLADIAPGNALERMLAERIISASWRIGRLGRAEQHVHDSIAAVEREELAQHGTYPQQEQDVEAYNQLRKARERELEWERMKQRRRHWARGQVCPEGLTLAIDLGRDSSQVERFSRYEKRLEGTIHRAWRELRLLRKGGEGQPARGDSTLDVRCSMLDVQSGTENIEHPTSNVEHRIEESGTSSPANVQNKANSPATDEPAEVYGALRAVPVKPVLTPAALEDPRSTGARGAVKDPADAEHHQPADGGGHGKSE